MKKFLLAILLVIVAGLTFMLNQYVPVLKGASGYAAKNICSGYFISGYAPELIKTEALEGAAPVLSNISYTIDEENRQVDAKMYGLFKRRAAYTEGIGCTLYPSGVKNLKMPVTPVPDVALADQVPWPLGRAAPAKSDRFDAVLDKAFAEATPDDPRRTKAVVIIHKGELVAERYVAGVGPETPLLGWSMAKSVTGLMAGILAGDGKLDITAPADVPQWQKKPGDPRAAITLDQLLRMSSGLEFNETYSTQSDVTQMLSNEADAGGFAAGKPLEAEPDTVWSYSSGTTNIISGILKRATGGTLQDYYSFAQARLFQPLGITSAIFESDAAGTFISSSYFYASARDWARLGQLCLQDGIWNGERLLPAGWASYLITPTSANPDNVYGAHFWLNRQPDDPDKERLWPDLPADTSYMGGFQGQFVLMIPSQELVIVRLGFTPGENFGATELTQGVIAVLDTNGEDTAG